MQHCNAEDKWQLKVPSGAAPSLLLGDRVEPRAAAALGSIKQSNPD